MKKLRAIGAGPALILPYGFFDGVATSGFGGAGFCLFLNESHSLEFALGARNCTNTKAKLISLWALLNVTQSMGIPKLNIFGDSAVIIGWAKGTSTLNLLPLVIGVLIQEDSSLASTTSPLAIFSVNTTRLQIVYQNLPLLWL